MEGFAFRQASSAGHNAVSAAVAPCTASSSSSSPAHCASVRAGQTDRLVSADGREFDPVANKSVLYVAPDGIMALSYTGSAYLAGVSTDRWIAETLAGGKLEEGVVFGHGMTCQPVGPALATLQEKLGSALGDPLTNPIVKDWEFELVSVGWRLSKKHPKPIAAVIAKAFGSSEIILRHYRSELGKQYRVMGTPSIHAAPVFPNLQPRLRAARGPDESESALVRAIRERSAEVPAEVGADCLSILMLPGRMGARVRYHPVRPAGVNLTSPSGEVTSTIDRAAFSPWVIGPSLYSSPSVLAGSFELHVSGFQIDLEAPTPPGPIDGAIGHVTPPPQPPF